MTSWKSLVGWFILVGLKQPPSMLYLSVCSNQFMTEQMCCVSADNNNNFNQSKPCNAVPPSSSSASDDFLFCFQTSKTCTSCCNHNRFPQRWFQSQTNFPPEILKCFIDLCVSSFLFSLFCSNFLSLPTGEYKTQTLQITCLHTLSRVFTVEFDVVTKLSTMGERDWKKACW